MSSESACRSCVKSVVLVALETGTTVVISYIVTNNLKTALTIGVVDSLIDLGVHIGYERVWSYIKWGYVKPEPVIQGHSDHGLDVYRREEIF